MAALVLDLTRSPAGLAAVLLVQGIPQGLLMLLGGVAIDRFRPRSVLAGAAAAQSLAVAALFAVAVSGKLQLWHLYIYALCAGGALAFFLPAESAAIPELLPPGQVRSGNALRRVSFDLAQFLVPPVAGAVVALYGPSPGFAVNALALAAAALFAWQIRPGGGAPAVIESPLQGFLEGVRAARREPAVWVTILMLAFFFLGIGGARFVGVPALAKLTLGAGDRGIGILYGAGGAGALVGALIAGSMPPVRRPALVFCINVIITGSAIAAVGFAPTLWAAVPFLVIHGAATSTSAVLMWTLVQTKAPPEARGRVIALVTLAVYGTQPLSHGLAGVISSFAGTRGILVIGGTMAALAGVYALAHRAMREAE